MPLPLPALRTAPLSRPCPGCFPLAARRRGRGLAAGPRAALAAPKAGGARPAPALRAARASLPPPAGSAGNFLRSPARPVPAPLSVFIPTPAGSGGVGLPALRQRRRAPIGLLPAAGVRGAGGGRAAGCRGVRRRSAPGPARLRVCVCLYIYYMCVCVCVYRRRSLGRWPGVSPGRWRLARLVCAGSLACSPAFLFLLPEGFYTQHTQSLPEGCSPGCFGVVFNSASFAW